MSYDMPELTETYQCCSCDRQFKDKPGPTQCPYCGHFYVRWLTYDENFKNGEGERVSKLPGLGG